MFCYLSVFRVVSCMVRFNCRQRWVEYALPLLLTLSCSCELGILICDHHELTAVCQFGIAPNMSMAMSSRWSLAGKNFSGLICFLLGWYHLHSKQLFRVVCISLALCRKLTSTCLPSYILHCFECPSDYG